MASFSSRPLFRVLALCIALGAGGAYVWKRQQRAAPPPPPPAEKVAEDEAIDLEEVLMSSSKSAQIFRDPDEDGKGKRTVLPSSKLGIMPEMEEDQAPDEGRKRLLPGSKNIDAVIEWGDLQSRDEIEKTWEDASKLPEPPPEEEEP